jgi:hypothetical protein
MNPIKEHCHNRTKQNIREIRRVFLDLDEDAPASLRAIRSAGDVSTPNFVPGTSARKNRVIWHVEGLDQDQPESLLRSLAAAFRRDPAATDVSRVLRVPGLANWKYNEQFLVRAVLETNQIYHLRDFAVYEDAPDELRYVSERSGPARRMPLGHRSQSEADRVRASSGEARSCTLLHPQGGFVTRCVSDFDSGRRMARPRGRSQNSWDWPDRCRIATVRPDHALPAGRLGVPKSVYGVLKSTSAYDGIHKHRCFVAAIGNYCDNWAAFYFDYFFAPFFVRLSATSLNSLE